MNLVEVDHTTVPLGTEVEVWWHSGPLSGCGQGGRLIARDGDTLTLSCGLGNYERVITLDEHTTLNVDEPLPAYDCLDYGPTCHGPVDYRAALSGTGRSFPRCEAHWAERLDRQAEISQRYPDSPFPPSDFDPTYAGESWEDD